MSSSNKPFVKYHSLPLTSQSIYASNQHQQQQQQIRAIGRLSSLSRAEKSLTALTAKFMTLLQESHNGVLDLRSVRVYFFSDSPYFFLLK
jgi:hypothetical protein